MKFSLPSFFYYVIYTIYLMTFKKWVNRGELVAHSQSSEYS